MADTTDAASRGNAVSYVNAARSLAPEIQSARRDIEHQRTLPTQLVEPMTKAGFFRLWRCHALGGPEVGFAQFAHVIEELSRADGSVGWCAMVALVFSRLSGYLPEDIAKGIFSDDSRLAGSINPTGKAMAVNGGYRVSGRWSYGSFIRHSNWTVGNSVVHDGDAPRRNPDGVPDIRFMIFPTSEVEIIDNLQTAGPDRVEVTTPASFVKAR